MSGIAQYKIKVFDESGNKVGELTSQTGQKVLNSFSFELLETGCGSFQIILNDFANFEIKRNDIIEIFLMNSTTAWYIGYIQKIPEVGRTDKMKIYAGYGFIAELDGVIANKIYAATETSLIIDNLIDDYVLTKTRIIKNAAKIVASAYTAQEANFEYTDLKKAIFDLVAQAANYVAGVDETREFFFIPRVNTIQVAAVKAIEKHIETFLPKEDISKIINKIYIKSAKNTGGSNFIGTVEDLVSQADYGLREDVKTFPTSGNSADALQWANQLLTEAKDPLITATIAGIDITLLSEKIEAKGRARILLRKET